MKDRGRRAAFFRAESNSPDWSFGVSGIGNDFSTRAIDQKVHGFQRRLTQEHLVSEDESFFKNFAIVDFDEHRAGHANRDFAAVGELGNLLMANQQSKVIGHIDRDDGSGGARICESINFTGTHTVSL